MCAGKELNMSNQVDFCTCPDHECPFNPVNHDKGCTPCMEKNILAGEVPSCLWNMISTREERQAIDCQYKFKDFAEMVQKKL